jgi:signal transduction histidine kinase
MNHFDWIHRRSNGENFPAEVHLSAFYLDGKQLLQATVRDVTARQRAEEVLIKGKEKAEELNKLKSNFLANMSHELRTPLISVLGFAEILEDELHDNFELGAMAATIKSGGRRLLKTLNFILDISILESGKIKTNIYESDIVSLIKVAFDSFSSTATQKGLTYSFNPSQKEIISVIDPVLFNSILENLLNNAFKFTTKGEVSVNVYIKAEKAIIEVIDTGIGISNEEQQIIWDEFRQASEGISRNYEGIGLGLTIVKKYTALMGGTISVGSIVGEGSNFTIEFPIAKAIVKATQEQVPDSLRNSEMNPLLRIKNSQR